MANLVETKLTSAGPKRILACDGGGILGLMSVEILAKLERDLRSASGNDKLVLADYFDFVCGTSTGAIIATCISLGMSTDKIRQFYVGSGELMFEKSSILKRAQYAYNDEPLAKMLRETINKELGYGATDQPAELGDANLKTLLMVVMRNHTTDSPWPVSNNPRAHYNDRSRPDCNLGLPLWQLVRASTAAPTFFPPEVVVFAQGTAKEYSFIFVDGGVTTYNNPAFLAFQMATARAYQMNWATGRDQLLIVSVGTGNAPRERPDLKAGDLWLLDHARNIPSALMNAASAGWDMACRTVGDCRYGAPIDREFGHAMHIEPKDPLPSTIPSQFTYVRYDPDVTATGLADLGLAKISPADVQVMDSVKHINQIGDVGAAYAEKYVLPSTHFPNFPPPR
ncbi:patatin-like phospholipase family protein [Bradyrhizobium vignae]|uniref:Patatin-like phospholipase family protein n=1 Tax=Bradyrhizobium vignae TaxID=1549949 RepID=A0ABS3ZNV3_9BRAD|nr:patatin-like phospholipase family protein [Bradyrhizobium vignae]MBP0109820.1 patatin-like phospholipase family protein [Bradyrhizobium vignae]